MNVVDIFFSLSFPVKDSMACTCTETHEITMTRATTLERATLRIERSVSYLLEEPKTGAPDAKPRERGAVGNAINIKMDLAPTTSAHTININGNH
jgi:hypothetical protein